MNSPLSIPTHFISGRKVLATLVFVFFLTLGLPGQPAHAASILVNSTADTTTSGDSQCTLREAVANANSDSDTTGGDCTAGSGTDTITFSGSVLGQTIILGGSQIILTSNMTIDGSSAGVTLDANNSSRIFQINSGSSVVLTRLALINGNVAGPGGAIHNLGTLTVNYNLIDGNTATTFGGGIANINAASSLTVNHSTIINNSIVSTGGTQAGGGGISNTGTMVINNSTISNNNVTGIATNRNGGGIRNVAGATGTLNNVTVILNSTDSNGGGITDGGAFTINNTLVANNTAGVQGPDCRGAITSNFSLVELTGGCTLTGGGNITSLDPVLGPLDANGGGNVEFPTFTYFPLDTSPALNAGSNASCLATDQRDHLRPVGVCDIGSVEKQTGEETDQHCTWTSGVPHTFGTDVNITITPNTSDDPGCITVLKRPMFAGGSQDGGEFPIIWTLTATNSLYNLDIDFCYTNLEQTTAGVADETSIVIFHLENGVWQTIATTPDPTNNCVSASGVTSLSPWTIVGNGEAPTIIELQNLTARPANSPAHLVVLFVALLGLVWGVALLRSRK